LHNPKDISGFMTAKSFRFVNDKTVSGPFSQYYVHNAGTQHEERVILTNVSIIYGTTDTVFAYAMIRQIRKQYPLIANDNSEKFFNYRFGTSHVIIVAHIPKNAVAGKSSSIGISWL
jgi:hypothetical protein